ncbi:hypothetical protein JCM30237_05930 [Halolamina litorea]|uniref:Uncharacterized protein n=1 Tax=Halolamina litorea TaxID=1515593 RepID=A0ABD6BS46_9EURY|nr:hypothetical protein [Halolamina litorea]
MSITDSLSEKEEQAAALVLIAFFGVIVLRSYSYYDVSELIELLLYAVVVQVLTQHLSITDFPGLKSRVKTVIVFIAISAAAVFYGEMLRQGLQRLLGTVYAIQVLGVVFLLSNVYLGLIRNPTGSIGSVLGLDEDVNLYGIVIPATTAVILPALHYSLGLNLVNVESIGGMLIVGSLCAATGYLSYDYCEE